MPDSEMFFIMMQQTRTAKCIFQQFRFCALLKIIPKVPARNMLGCIWRRLSRDRIGAVVKSASVWWERNSLQVYLNKTVGQKMRSVTRNRWPFKNFADGFQPYISA